MNKLRYSSNAAFPASWWAPPRSPIRSCAALPSYAAASGSAPTYLILLFTPCGCVRPVWGATDASGKDVLPPVPARRSRSPATSTSATRSLLRQGGTVGGTAGRPTCRARSSSSTASTTRRRRARTRRAWPRCGPGRSRQRRAGDRASASTSRSRACSRPGTPFPSIQLMVRDPADFTDREVKTRMIYNAAGVFVDPHRRSRSRRATTLLPGHDADHRARTRRPSSGSSCSAAAARRRAQQRARADAQALHPGPHPAAGAAGRVERPRHAAQAAATAAAQVHAARRRAPATRRRPTSPPTPSCRWTSWRWRWPAISPAWRASSSRRRPAR